MDNTKVPLLGMTLRHQGSAEIVNLNNRFGHCHPILVHELKTAVYKCIDENDSVILSTIHTE